MAKKPTKKQPAEQPDDAPPFVDPEVCQEAQAAVIWSYDDTGHALTLEQQLFCRSYIIDRNPVAAMRRLSYAGSPAELRKKADHYLMNLEVQACIDVLAKQMMQRLEITAENVNRRLAAVAFFDPRTVVAFDHIGVQMKHSKFWSLDEAWAISSVKQGKDGVELKIHDGVRAAEILGKQLGSLKDDSEEARASQLKQSAQEVIGSIIDIMRKTREERDHLIELKPLPAPDGA